ncbi:hypothetical protein D3C73_974900 [compost metagenome]
MIDRQNALLACELGTEALKTLLIGNILRCERAQVLAVQTAVRIEQNHAVIINQHKGYLLIAVPYLQIAEDRLELPVLDLHDQNTDILKITELFNQPNLREHRFSPGQFRIFMRRQPFWHTVKLHDFLVQITAFELVVRKRAEVLFIENRDNLRAALAVEVVKEGVADRRMVIEQAAEIPLAGIQAELLRIGQVLFGRIIGTERHMKDRGSNSIVGYVIHIFEHIGDAVANRLKRILRLLAVLFLNGIISDEEHNHAKNKKRNNNQAQKGCKQLIAQIHRLRS